MELKCLESQCNSEVFNQPMPLLGELEVNANQFQLFGGPAPAYPLGDGLGDARPPTG